MDRTRIRISRMKFHHDYMYLGIPNYIFVLSLIFPLMPSRSLFCQDRRSRDGKFRVSNPPMTSVQHRGRLIRRTNRPYVSPERLNRGPARGGRQGPAMRSKASARGPSQLQVRVTTSGGSRLVHPYRYPWARGIKLVLRGFQMSSRDAPVPFNLGNGDGSEQFC